jgi:acetyl-CoA carboxylase carboxyltransferase component
MYVTGAIVVFMVTGRMVYDWKMGTNQVQQVSGMVSKIKEEIVERTPKPKSFDDEAI